MHIQLLKRSPLYLNMFFPGSSRNPRSNCMPCSTNSRAHGWYTLLKGMAPWKKEIQNKEIYFQRCSTNGSVRHLAVAGQRIVWVQGEERSHEGALRRAPHLGPNEQSTRSRRRTQCLLFNQCTKHDATNQLKRQRWWKGEC